MPIAKVASGGEQSRLMLALKKTFRGKERFANNVV